MFRFGLGSYHSFDYVNASRQSRMDSRPRVPKSGQVTPRLPNEIFQRVIQQLADTDAKRSLASILVTSRAAYDAVAPTLYKEVILTRQGADSFYRGLNPGLPRIKQPKREKTVTWDQFISKADKHVQDQHRKKRDKHMKGGGGKRKLHAVWPHVYIDSDNEDDKDDDDEADDTAYDYPTDVSLDRKRRLFGLVQRLHVEDIPSLHLSENLARLRRQSQLPPMPLLKSISFRPLATWHVLDWEDRHESREGHPFITYLGSLQATDLCVQLPNIDCHVEKSFMMTRIVSEEQHAFRESGQDQSTYLRSRLANLTSGRYNRMSRFAAHISGYLCKKLTIHNLVADIPSTVCITSCRVFYRPCPCRDFSSSVKVNDKYCYTHFAPHTRVNKGDLPKLENSFLGDNLERLELVDVDWNRGSLEYPRRDNVAVENLQTAISKSEPKEKEYMEKTVVFMSSREAEPCFCCGKRQLSGEESSIAPSE